MATPKIIPFALRGIETHQFAIIKSSYRADAEPQFQVGLNVGAADEVHAVSIFFEVSFLNNNTPFVLLEAECQFEIEEQVYQSFYNKIENKMTIPKGLCQHLGVITVGTARGILFEKLKDTEFRHLLLPTIDVTEQLSTDFVLTKDK